MPKSKLLISALVSFIALTGCASKPKDFSAFDRSDPKTILILPPKNSSPEVKATYGFYSSVQMPIAESGFYVLPITLVDEHFKTNGLTISDEIHIVEREKLREVFGADAALYIDIKEYGTKYFVIGSASIVRAEGRLIDLRDGRELWKGEAAASSEEGQNNNQGGIAGLLIAAIVKQVMATALDQSYDVAKMANLRLFHAQSPNGLLYGPRHPLYKTKK